MNNEEKTKAELKAEKKQAAEEAKQKKKSKGGKSGLKVIISVIVAVIMFAAIVLLEKSALDNYEKTQVVVAKETVHMGADITKENATKYFKVSEVPASIVPDGSYKNVDELIGLYATCEIVAKEIPVDKNFTDVNILTKVEDPVEVSFAIPAFSQAVAGTLRRGDTVNMSVKNSNGNVNDEGFVLENVLIKNAYSAEGKVLEVGNDGQAIMFVVIVNKDDALQLNSVIANGGLVLLSKTNNVQY